MKYKKRRFAAGECMHIYQRSVKGFNIFYDLEDYLVFYTIFSIVARQYRITVLMLCIMINHVHILLSSMNLKAVSDFIMHYTSMFVREYNEDIGRKGRLFHKSFGSAPKKGSKSIRSAIVYIGNNPVEKDLCASAEQYAWNFLTFMGPDMEPQVAVRSLSKKLQKAFKEVTDMRQKSAYLGYARLRRLFRNLSSDEKSLLVRHIIHEYFPFEKEILLSFYGSYDDMITAMRSTSGSEYDIREVYYPESDSVYQDMSSLVRKYAADPLMKKQVRRVTTLNVDRKLEIAGLLRHHTAASLRQIENFLNLSVDKRNGRS